MEKLNLERIKELYQIKEEVMDVLRCIAIFDPGETLKNKGRYFKVIRKDAKKLLKKIEKDGN